MVFQTPDRVNPAPLPVNFAFLMKECRLSELEPRASRNCGPNDDGAPMSKASAVAPRAGSLPMSTAAAESPSEQRRKKTSWQQSTGEEMVWRNVRRTVWCCGKSGCAFVRQTECCPFCICCFDNQLHIHRCPFAARYFSVLVSSSGLWP